VADFLEIFVSWIDPYTFSEVDAGDGFFIIAVILLVVLVEAYKKGIKRFLITLAAMSAVGVAIAVFPLIGLILAAAALLLFLIGMVLA